MYWWLSEYFKTMFVPLPVLMLSNEFRMLLIIINQPDITKLSRKKYKITTALKIVNFWSASLSLNLPIQANMFSNTKYEQKMSVLKSSVFEDYLEIFPFYSMLYDLTVCSFHSFVSLWLHCYSFLDLSHFLLATLNVLVAIFNSDTRSSRNIFIYFPRPWLHIIPSSITVFIQIFHFRRKLTQNRTTSQNFGICPKEKLISRCASGWKNLNGQLQMING